MAGAQSSGGVGARAAILRPLPDCRQRALRARLRTCHQQVLEAAARSMGLGTAELAQLLEAATQLRSWYERAAEVLDPQFEDRLAAAQRAARGRRDADYD
eukprot:2893594-Prymnesium_polylepis.1